MIELAIMCWALSMGLLLVVTLSWFVDHYFWERGLTYAAYMLALSSTVILWSLL